MERIEVAGRVLRLFAGAVVKLTEAQAKPRMHAIKATAAKGVFEVLSPIEFKVGEVVEAQLGSGGVTEKTLGRSPRSRVPGAKKLSEGG